MRRSPLFVVFFTIFLDLLGFGLVLPLLPQFARQFGASDTQIGLLFASYSLMQFLFAPLWGRLSDRIGRRPVLLISISGSAGANLLLAFAPSLAWLLASRLFAGMMAANVGTAQAYVADVTAPADRARGMGMVGAAFGLGFVFGPMLAIFVGDWGQQGVGLTAAALSLVDLALAAAILPESLPPERRREARAARGNRLRQMGQALSNPAIGPAILIFFLGTFAFGTFETTFTLFLADRLGVRSPGEVGGYFGYLGVLAALVQGGVTGRLARKTGEAPLVVAGCVLLAAGYGLLPTAAAQPAVLATLALIGFGQALNQPAVNSLISRSAGAAEQGSILGVNQGFSSLARVFGPAAGGWLYQRGPAYPYWLSAGVVVAAGGLAAWIAARAPQPAGPVSGGR
jgi:predicted MFS family arabinose efflux permease